VSEPNQSAGPLLEASEIAALEAFGTRRPTRVGEYLYREGDPAYDFYVVLSGAGRSVHHR
jgi:thioredoxin reductase (NADPH)